jgi:hypothetical protein
MLIQNFQQVTDPALDAPDHEFGQIVESKFFGLQKPLIRLPKAAAA